MPDAVRRVLWRDTASLREAGLPVRWVREDGVHLTIKFLGEQPPTRESEIAAALGEVALRSRPFSLALQGLGAFPDLRRPRVIWAGLEPVPALELLQHDIEETLAGLGFEPDARPFHPHVTLGRSKVGARRDAFKSLEALVESQPVRGDFGVEHVVLMESQLTPAGARYRTVREFALGDR